MNEMTLAYWNQYLEKSKVHPLTEVEAFQFGDDANALAELVVSGKKTATCSAYMLYEIENEPLPYIGQYAIVLDAADQPMAIIQTTEVTIQAMNEVSEAFALAEGEGTYREWWDIHERFFSELLRSYQLSFTPSMNIVCERFKVVDQFNAKE
ncbi:ASCH domain-containing protein [Exiguobacterium sp. MER 193]|uniref:ASCH domain-containing protein n=1 Tax=Exiguobacterium sp. MER 193 TaxID=2939564 RepID=UPI00203AB7E1|nr:ASCH domain-containing protein [Exiguobacterium sp. MER 193]MCM3280761.1 ASCH domain-containing protein [Exiguobacterium sp. MER 193]